MNNEIAAKIKTMNEVTIVVGYTIKFELIEETHDHFGRELANTVRCLRITSTSPEGDQAVVEFEEDILDKALRMLKGGLK